MTADLDNGYTRIANELLESLASLDLSGREFRVALTVMRKTYGFHKKVDWISRDQISEITGISSENVSRMITMLVGKKILLQEGFGNIKKMGINTNVASWNSVESDTIDAPKRHSIVSKTTLDNVESDTARVESDTLSCRIRQTQKKKETLPKETSTKERFEMLWNAFDGRYGEKGSKKSAFNAFDKLKPDDPLFDAMLSAVNAQTAEREIAQATGQFKAKFQHVERWIKNERWTDDPDRQLAQQPVGRKTKSDENDEATRRFLEEAGAYGRDVDSVAEHEARLLIGRKH